MPVLNTTPRNSFRYATSANNGADFAAGWQDFADDVDAMWSEGTLVARPSAGTTGRQYYATDTGIIYWDTGSAWVQPGAFAPPAVTSLPGGPVDGQECRFVADAANGVVWKFCYRAASSSPYKWEFVGGAPLQTQNATPQTITATGYGSALPASNVQLGLPAVAGDFDVTVGAKLSIAASAATASLFLSFSLTGVNAADTDALLATIASGDGQLNSTGAVTTRHTGVSNSGTVRAEAKVAGSVSVASLQDVRLSVVPVRVG